MWALTQPVRSALAVTWRRWLLVVMSHNRSPRNSLRHSLTSPTPSQSSCAMEGEPAASPGAGRLTRSQAKRPASGGPGSALKSPLLSDFYQPAAKRTRTRAPAAAPTLRSIRRRGGLACEAPQLTGHLGLLPQEVGPRHPDGVPLPTGAPVADAPTQLAPQTLCLRPRGPTTPSPAPHPSNHGVICR